MLSVLVPEETRTDVAGKQARPFVRGKDSVRTMVRPPIVEDAVTQNL
jgi:hypothetical protein